MVRRRQPATGTVGHPYSALNLRLALATFGLIALAALAVVLAVMDYPVAAAVAAVAAAAAAINVVVVQWRRAERRRREPGVRHSLFE